MFKAWNIIDCGLRKESTGHQYWETKALSDELLKQGSEARIFCHGEIAQSSFPGATIESAFPLYYYNGVSKDPNWHFLENFIVHNRAFESALSELDRSLFVNSVNLLPTLCERQLLGTLRWLAGFEQPARPKIGIFLYPLYDWSEANAVARLYRRLWKECGPAVRKQVVLMSRMEGTAKHFMKLLDAKVHVMPSLLCPPESAMREAAKHLAGPSGAAQSGPMLVSYVGGGRRERGGELIPEAVERCASLDVRFFIQAKSGSDPLFDINQLTSLHGRSNVTCHEGLLDPEAYFGAMANSIVLLPYNPEHYALKSSGVYFEAKCLGAPVIVTKGTWMADDVRKNGNGVIAESFSAAGIADAVARALKERERLSAAAQACSRGYADQHGAGRFIDTVEKLFASTRQAG